MVGMLLTGGIRSKLVNTAGNDGLLNGNPGFFFIQLKAMAIAVGYSFAVSYGIFKFVNFIVPVRSARKRRKRVWMQVSMTRSIRQGTLLVATPEGLKEQEINVIDDIIYKKAGLYAGYNGRAFL